MAAGTTISPSFTGGSAGPSGAQIGSDFTVNGSSGLGGGAQGWVVWVVVGVVALAALFLFMRRK